jgi:transposase-like protein
MTYSDEFRWRAVAVMHIYNIASLYVSELFGPKQRTLRRWYELFLKKGILNEKAACETSSRWPPEVIAAVEAYVSTHPTFYIEELREL